MLLATVLFLIAVSQRFRIVAVRVAVIGLAAVILFSAVALLVSLPRL